MKRMFTIFLSLLFVSVFFLPLNAQTYETNQPSKAVNIIYDDSGSMIRSGGVGGTGPLLDRWGQAKYAMEVFAAMLEENDTMSVYYMSDYVIANGGRIDAPPKVTVRGSEPASARVSRIRNTVTRASNTPFDPVVKAYNDLKAITADDKWMVILTDGEFNLLNGVAAENIDVNGKLSDYAYDSDISINLLAIGDDEDLNRMVRTINPNANIGYYFDHARDPKEILGKITSICNRIFNRNTLKFSDESKYEFKFDIPMIELLVFAQGGDVKINGIKGGKTFNPVETVNVRYSDRAALNVNFNVLVSRELTGVISKFHDIPKGSYSLDISGAQTVEIYYKPDVHMNIKLMKGRKEIRSNEVEAGNYRIDFGIVNEKGEYFESDLLGNVTYEAVITNDGKEYPVSNGDTVKLEAGDYKVNVKARFLEINTAEASQSRSIFPEIPWIKKYWFIFWPLVIILLAFLLWWWLWGTKKRFPKGMARNPVVSKEENESEAGFGRGNFIIDKKSKWKPRSPETGTIKPVDAGSCPLPTLRVKADGNNKMILTNTEKFWPDKLSLLKLDFFIDDYQVQEDERDLKMSCFAEVKTVFYSGNGNTKTYICSLAFKKGRR